MDNTDERQPAPFIEDFEQEGVSYIKPNLDMSLRDDQKKDCRDIVMEIRKFGVSQRQILFIINLLALELENVEVMKEIRKAVSENREQVSLQKQDTKKKLILGK